MSLLAISDAHAHARPEVSQRAGLHGAAPNVAAIVLHRGVDTYLEQSVLSLYSQSTPLSAIVVAHIGAGDPPSWICRRFPDVCLLRATGPARSAAVVDEIMATIAADGYLFQEATDWSAPDRLGRLLLTARHGGADLVGSNYVVVEPRIPDAHTRAMPPDGNQAFRRNTGGTIVEPCTMLVDRHLVERLSGFNTNLTVAAADEFVARAAVVARVLNVPSSLYFHREQEASDWSSTSTARSLRGRVVLAALSERSRHHALLVARRRHPDVAVRSRRRPVDLVAVRDGSPLGPPDHDRDALALPSREPSALGGHHAIVPAVASQAAKPPILVVSAFDSLSRFIACCLGQHPLLTTVDVTRWLPEVAGLATRFFDSERTRDAGDWIAPTATAESVYASASKAVDALFVGGPFASHGVEQGDASGARRWVGAVPAERAALTAAALLYPAATFLHVVRPVDSAVAAQLEAEENADVEELYSAWLSDTRTILDVAQLLDPQRTHTLRYEDVVRGPDDVLRSCLQALGEAPEPSCAALFVRSGADAPPMGQSIPELAGVPAQAEARRFSVALNGAPKPSNESERLTVLSKVLRQCDEPQDRRRRVSGNRNDDRNPYAAAHDLVRRHAPRNAHVCVVSKGDEMAVRIRGHSMGWHFPQTEDGTYAGYHPIDAGEAIAHLEHLRDRGAQLFLIPKQYLWWLTHYTELRQHLERSYARVPSNEEEGALFDLRRQPSRDPSLPGRGTA